MRVLQAALLVLAAAAVAVLLPGAEAQDSTLGLVPSAPEGTLDPGASLDIEVQVQVECAFLVTSGGSASVELAVEGLPEGVTGSGGTVDLSAQACLDEPGSTEVQQNGTVTLSASEDAPGLVPVEGTITGSATDAAGGTASGEAPLPDGILIGYRPGHTLDPEDRSFDVEGGTHSFNLTIEVTANARTMVMFQGKQVEPGGQLNGLRSVTFEVAEDHRMETLPITFTAPDGAWDQVNATFETFSHCLDGEACDPTQHQNITWTFVNTGGNGGGNGGGGGEESPGVGLLGVLVLAAVALVLRRRA